MRISSPAVATAVALVVATALVVLGCGDSSPSGPGNEEQPVPGWLRVRFESPHADEGGVLFTVSGGPIDSVRSAFSNLYSASPDPSSRRILVAGELGSGAVVAEILVPDLALADAYAATVEQVAARGTFEQREPGTGSLILER